MIFRKAAAVALAGALTFGCRDGVPRGEPAAGPPPGATPGAVVAPTSSASPTPERVRVHGGNADGIPLHETIGDSRVSGRLAPGSEVAVLESTADGRWIHVRANDGATGWITRRYVEGDAGAAPPEAELVVPTSSVWSSRASCEAALDAKQKLERPNGVARIGTWNVRWFPDGKPGHGKDDGGTDIAWLACAIAWLDVDVLAVQEFKNNAHARIKTAELVRLLDRLTNGSWTVELDDCPNLDAQHVGVLANRKRVKTSTRVMLASLNPRGERCKDNLRPGLATYLEFAGGLDLFLVSVHAKSGSERRALDLRETALKGIDRAVLELDRTKSDPDVVFAGDFNTMGCKDCSPAIAPSEELSRTDELIAHGSPVFRRISPTQACSEYSERQATLLDHFVVSKSFAELGSDSRATISGICGESACRTGRSGERPAAQQALSDHCPLVLDIVDRDQD